MCARATCYCRTFQDLYKQKLSYFKPVKKKVNCLFTICSLFIVCNIFRIKALLLVIVFCNIFRITASLNEPGFSSQCTPPTPRCRCSSVLAVCVAEPLEDGPEGPDGPDGPEDGPEDGSGPENGGSSSEKEQDPASSPEGSKPGSCYTPDPPEPSSHPEERRPPRTGGSEKEVESPSQRYSPRDQVVQGLSGSISLPLSLRTNRPPLEVLKKIFPSHKPPVLDLILRGCGGDLAGAIEVLLSSRNPDGSGPAHIDPLPEGLVLPPNGHLLDPGLGPYPHPGSSSNKWSVGSAFRVPDSLRFGSEPSPGALGVPLQHPSFPQPGRYPLMLRSSLTRAHAGPFVHNDVTLWGSVALQQQYQLRSAAQYVSPFSPGPASGPAVFRGSPLIPSRTSEEPRVNVQEEACVLGSKPGLYSSEEEFEDRTESADTRILNRTLDSS